MLHFPKDETNALELELTPNKERLACQGEGWGKGSPKLCLAYRAGKSRRLRCCHGPPPDCRHQSLPIVPMPLNYGIMGTDQTAAWREDALGGPPKNAHNMRKMR